MVIFCKKKKKKSKSKYQITKEMRLAEKWWRTGTSNK